MLLRKIQVTSRRYGLDTIVGDLESLLQEIEGSLPEARLVFELRAGDGRRLCISAICDLNCVSISIRRENEAGMQELDDCFPIRRAVRIAREYFRGKSDLAAHYESHDPRNFAGSSDEFLSTLFKRFERQNRPWWIFW